MIKMQYAKDSIDNVIQANIVNTPQNRREILYTCLECDQEVEYVFLQSGKNYFRHKKDHEICILSSIIGGGKSKQEDMEEFLSVRRSLTDYLSKSNKIIQNSNINWKTSSAEIYLLPHYFPEKKLIEIHNYCINQGKNLFLLIPRDFTEEEIDNIITYGNYIYKVRGIHRYAFDNSSPNQLILTNGSEFYKLTEPRKVWSKKIKAYCKTIFKYETELIFFYSLI